MYEDKISKVKLSAKSQMIYINCLIHHFKDLEPAEGNSVAFSLFEEDFGDYSKFKANIQELHKAGLVMITSSNITFIKKYIGSINQNNFTNLHDVIDKYNNIFVKMDIEGGEIEWLKSLNETHLNKFSQIAIEFHNPFTSKEIMAFEKLNKTHVLVHFHANNCCGVRIHKGVKIPNIFECTYIHKKYYIGPYKLNNENIPGSLDMKNVLDKDEIIIDYKPFVNI
jgi:FkbM family methyltransferase